MTATPLSMCFRLTFIWSLELEGGYGVQVFVLFRDVTVRRTHVTKVKTGRGKV